MYRIQMDILDKQFIGLPVAFTIADRWYRIARTQNRKPLFFMH